MEVGLACNVLWDVQPRAAAVAGGARQLLFGATNSEDSGGQDTEQPAR